MDALTSLARGTALVSALAEGVASGGWLATRGLDDRPELRRRVKVSLLAGYFAGVVLDQLVWLPVAHPAAGIIQMDRRGLQQYVAVAGAATVVLSVADGRVPRALAGRGVRHPHLVFGAVAGVSYAAATYPIWRRLAHQRLRFALDHPAPPGAHPRLPPG